MERIFAHLSSENDRNKSVIVQAFARLFPRIW